MPATRPTLRPLVGHFIRLEPMTQLDLPALFFAIGHPRVFAGGYGGGPAGFRDTAAGFIEWAGGYFDWARGNVYGVRLIGGAHDGQLVGTTTLSDFDLPNEATHIGWTAYDPRVWGTAVNAEAKRLLLALAFDEHGFGRVKIQADVLNERSRAAIAGLGATFEGVARRDLRRADGSWRDSAIYSVIVDDWPALRARLDARLATYAGQPVRFRE
jgi:RimJ/RimL family protein N-acetyltransferase